MGRGNLGKLLRLKRSVDKAEVTVESRKRRSGGQRGGGSNKKKALQGQARPVHARPHGYADAPCDTNENHVDMEQLLGLGTAYASLVGALSVSSSALRQRRLQQEGDSDEASEDGSGNGSDEEEKEEQDKAAGAPDNSDGAKSSITAGGVSEPAGSRQIPVGGASLEADDGPLDTWSRRGLQAAAASAATAAAVAAAAGPEAAAAAKQQQLKPLAAALKPQFQAPSSSGAVPDNWVDHMDRELTDAEQAALQGPGRSKLSDVDVGPDYKAGAPRHARWQLSGRASLPDAPEDLAAHSVKERLLARWAEVHEEDAAKQLAVKGVNGRERDGSQAEAAAGTSGRNCGSGVGFASPRQRAFFSALSSYADVVVPCRPYPSSLDEPDEHMDAYLLHALNHVAKASDRIKKNNDKLEAAATAAAAAVAAAKAAPKGDKEAAKAAGEGKAAQKGVMVEPGEAVPRDQGFTRPKVLILLPQRNLAFKLVRRLVALAMRETRADSVQGKEKFVEQFTNTEEDDEEDMDPKLLARRAAKPAEWRALLSGSNTDDHFRLGIKITRGAIRLFADHFQSDIIVTSPIALATKLAEDPGGKGGGLSSEADFLSSIEMLVIDRADVLSMQNWSHVETVVEALNQLPREQHGTDIMRVREWCLSGLSRHYRQTVLLSSFLNADMNRLVSSACCNYEGQIRVMPEQAGVLSAVVPQVQQLFERFSGSSPADTPSARFEFFKRTVWPRIKETGSDGQLIFIPHYFDFVRVRNFLNQEEADFASICEYTRPPDVTAARSRFFHRHRRILLYTERAHFYNRHRIRGIKDVLFYSLPEHGHYYSELLNLLETDGLPAASAAAGGPTHATVSALFCKFDLMQLERVVGSSRAKKMVASTSESSTFMFC